jgi:hypothetical protein
MRQLGAEDFDGDETVMFEIAGEIDGGHPAMTQFALDAVSVGKKRGKLAQRIRHLEGSP